MIKRRFAYETPAFDTPMFLRDRQGIFATRFFNFDAFDRFPVRDDKVRIGGRAQEISVEPDLLGRPRLLVHSAAGVGKWIHSRNSAAIAERNCNGVVGVTR